MSIRVRVFCTKSLSSVTPELLTEAISGKLAALVALHPATEDEPVREVLSRLRIERADGGDGFGVFRLHYTADAQRALRLERRVGRAFEEERRELFDEAAGREGLEADRVRALLTDARECAAIELKVSDASGIGWPLALAAAASLAKAGNGLIRADGEGWLEPKGKEVAVVMAEKG